MVRRFVFEMIYGIQARQSVHLTEIARSLEERIAVKKTHSRLCRQLGRWWLWEKLTEALCRLGALRVLDITDLSKKYAEKIEYLARVRDGSEGELAQGYWALNVIGTEVGEARIIPFYGRLYSQLDPDFQSENAEIRRAMIKICRHAQKRGVWVLDRGGDRRELLDFLDDRQLRFIIRSKGERGMLYRGKKMSILEAALSCPLPYAERLVKEEQGKERIYRLEFGSRQVRFDERRRPLWLVVVQGFGQEPLMLLTNLPIRPSRSHLWRVVESYLIRWRIEETIRFIKQSYQLEDIRLLTYTRLQNTMALVIAVAYFATVYLGLRTKLRVLARHVLRAARRLFGLPDFRFYALADGIREFLFSQRRGLKSLYSMFSAESLQRSLFDP